METLFQAPHPYIVHDVGLADDHRRVGLEFRHHLLIIQNPARAIAVFDTTEIAGSKDDYIFTGVLAAAEDFVKCCTGGGQPMCAFENAVNTMKVAEVILAQSLLKEGL
jgi:hypothetical protein